MITYYYSNGSKNGRKTPFGNPLANLLVLLVGGLALAAFVVLGFFAFLIVGSLVMIMAAVIAVRIWWFNRKFATANGSAGRDSELNERSTRADVIEGEFQELSGSSDRDDRTPPS